MFKQNVLTEYFNRGSNNQNSQDFSIAFLYTYIIIIVMAKYY